MGNLDDRLFTVMDHIDVYIFCCCQVFQKDCKQNILYQIWLKLSLYFSFKVWTMFFPKQPLLHFPK